LYVTKVISLLCYCIILFWQFVWFTFSVKRYSGYFIIYECNFYLYLIGCIFPLKMSFCNLYSHAMFHKHKLYYLYNVWTAAKGGISKINSIEIVPAAYYNFCCFFLLAMVWPVFNSNSSFGIKNKLTCCENCRWYR
jgi:hypothetical protein